MGCEGRELFWRSPYFYLTDRRPAGMREEMLGLLRVMAPWLAVPSAWSADTELCSA